MRKVNPEESDSESSEVGEYEIVDTNINAHLYCVTLNNRIPQNTKELPPGADDELDFAVALKVPSIMYLVPEKYSQDES